MSPTFRFVVAEDLPVDSLVAQAARDTMAARPAEDPVTAHRALLAHGETRALRNRRRDDELHRVGSVAAVPVLAEG